MYGIYDIHTYIFHINNTDDRPQQPTKHEDSFPQTLHLFPHLSIYSINKYLVPKHSTGSQ